MHKERGEREGEIERERGGGVRERERYIRIYHMTFCTIYCRDNSKQL